MVLLGCVEFIMDETGTGTGQGLLPSPKGKAA